MTSRSKRSNDRCPSHPGEFLTEVILPSVKLPKKQLAKLLRMSPHTFKSFLDGERPVTHALALRLAKMFGGSASAWLQMQFAYDQWQVENVLAAEMESELASIPCIAAQMSD
jgi:addiction module HigA family antidote